MPPLRVSAITGPSSSIPISSAALAAVVRMGRSTIARTTQNTWATAIVQTYASAAPRRGGSSRAARSQRKTMGMRMTTYPATITPLSRTSPSSIDANACSRPSASTITPTICTIVARRITQSSVSYADANHE